MIQDYIKEQSERVNRQLELLVPDEAAPHKKLFQAARYALLGEAKRMRPLFALATTEALGGNAEHALVPACALELIHTYSLIHDDLPCMDDDDFRRGKPSLHKQYDEGVATLTGDFLLTHAFQVLASAPHLRAKQKLSLMQILAERSGGSGMVAGQILDLEAERKPLSLEELKNLHRKKTGALLSASIEFGAVCAGAKKAELKTLCRIGENMGLAYQIIDDVLDVTESEKKHGKKISSDQVNGKTTYVSLLGLEKAQKAAYELLEGAIEALRKLHLEKTHLTKLILLLQQKSK